MVRRTDRPLAALGLSAAFLIFAVLLSVCLGPVPMSPTDLWRALSGTDELYTPILYYIRLPRTLGAVLAGCGLALSGALIQSVLDNPLAGPNIVGVNAGAGFAAALCCALFPGAPGAAAAASLAGALCSAFLIFLLARRTGASRITLVLAGMAVNYILNAGTDAVVTLVPDALPGSAEFRIGSLAGVTFARLMPAAALILPALCAALMLSHDMEVLSLGEETARSLGLPAGLVRTALLFLASVLAGASVSFAGLLGFVGLLVPHGARFFAGGEGRWLLPLSAVMGAAFLTFCDVLSRVLFAPFELPVGIIMAFFGAPFFIWLLLRQRGGRTSA